jgi:6-phospho-3-hexuloisomerase
VTVKENASGAVDELRELVDALDENQLETVAAILVDAPRVFFTGIGRSGLSARAVAMRLMHIGKPSFVVGEVATPSIGDGDVLVAVSSSGRGSILDQARAAVGHGARIVSLTTDENEMTELSDAFVAVPARTVVSTAQHAGSLFEQGCLIVGDALCREVQSRLGVPTSDLNARHANIL